MSVTSAQVVAFWRDAGPLKWFRGGDAFDAECRERLGDAHHAAARRELDDWSSSAEGALALLLLLLLSPLPSLLMSLTSSPLLDHYFEVLNQSQLLLQCLVLFRTKSHYGFLISQPQSSLIYLSCPGFVSLYQTFIS